MSKDDEPGWVMGTITKTVQQRMERFWHKQMKLDELTQLQLEDTAKYFGEGDKKYATSKLKDPAVVQPQTDDYAVAPAPTTFGELMDCLDIVARIWKMPQGMSWPGSRHLRLGSGNPQSNTCLSGLTPAA